MTSSVGFNFLGIITLTILDIDYIFIYSHILSFFSVGEGGRVMLLWFVVLKFGKKP